MSKTSPRPTSETEAWHVPVGGKGFALDRLDPDARPYSLGSKAADEERTQALAEEIGRLQELLWVDRRFKLLVLLQGSDTSGKDGVIRAVFRQTSPLGVRAINWQAPTRQERDHDFLWRIHQHVPSAGQIAIFNRSHYEDVLVPVVQCQIDRHDTAVRYRQINDFERMLVETGTVLMKFMLHISHEEQRQRLQARADTPHKRWKLRPEDLQARSLWPQYQQAYEQLLCATSTDWAPWTVVPANNKAHRNLMIATLVHDRLKALKLRYPPDDPRMMDVKIV